eukprot:m.222224 g.222224  ORF g.222224 m.222224 type:complete len:610 (-) comp33366_c1_seq7:322-2151(-)
MFALSPIFTFQTSITMKESSILFVCAAFACVGLGVGTRDCTTNPCVTTSSGTVNGQILPPSSNVGAVTVNEYLGIPFATADRWEAPVDFHRPYDGGVVNASMWGAACLQVLGPNTTYGSEDCLRVNVWQPATAKPGDKLKVMVFIYGGSNQFGEAEPYNMSGIAAFQNTICVNLNYRTGPIGWMAFEEDVEAGKSTGNWGLLDIQSALRWVQKEISNFGGNPATVAIHGQSSGGGLVELQYVSPSANGLFQAAISESGGLDATSLEDGLTNTLQMASTVGCADKAGRVNKRCMVALEPLQITNMTYFGSWNPTVDGITLPADPMQLLIQGKVNNVSVIFGSQTNDSQLFLFKDNTIGDEGQPNTLPNGDLMGMNASAYTDAVENMVPQSVLAEALALYPVDSTTEGPSLANLHRLGSVESDQMSCGLRSRARLFDLARPGDAYCYRFNYWYQSNSQCTAVPNYHKSYMGAVHQDEVTFVMAQPNFMEDGSCCGKWGLSQGEEGCARLAECTQCYNETFGVGYQAYFNDKELSFAKMIGKFWTTFSTGNPNPPADAAEEEETRSQFWPSISYGGLVFDADEESGAKVEVELYDDPKICQFWAKAASANAN